MVVLVARGSASGTLAELGVYGLFQPSLAGVVAADFNGDGLVDIATFTNQPTNLGAVEVKMNQGCL